MLDKRIGTYNDDGSVQTWPEVTYTGRDYTRPVSTTRLSKRHFCVTDNDILDPRERDAAIDALRVIAGEHRSAGGPVSPANLIVIGEPGPEIVKLPNKAKRK